MIILTERLILKQTQDDSRRYAIFERCSLCEIGHIAVYEDSEEFRADTKELGYAIHAPFRGKGFMQEAIKAVLESLFNSGIKYVWACCVQTNIPSKNLIEKLGFDFVREGTFDKDGTGNEVPSFEYVMTDAKYSRLFVN